MREALYPDGAYLTYDLVWERHRVPRTTLGRLNKKKKVATLVRSYCTRRGAFKQRMFREQDIIDYKKSRRGGWDGQVVSARNRSLSLTAAAHESGIDRRQLWKYIKAGKLTATLENPPSGQRGRGRMMYMIAADSLRKLQKEMAAETKAPPAGWERARQIAVRLHIAGAENSIFLSSFLRQGREDGCLHAVRIRRKSPPHRFVWYYDPSEVDALIEGRSEQFPAESTDCKKQEAKTERKKPARGKHLQWQAWRKDGLSYNKIVQRHLDETGEEVTREAIMFALKRLQGSPA